MITNERQYRITRREMGKFEEAIAALSEREVDRASEDALFRDLQIAAMRSQLDDLQADIDEYQAIKSGERSRLTLDSFDQLPRALVAARIAAGLTQGDLANRLGVHVQQVQRYEASGYASASTRRVTEVVRALGISIQIDVALAPAGQTSDAS
ncbi:MAG: helix-turn-helix domain-containing protein [Chloroflexota bacterium]|nr:helix-turn-helix domain-containing protein [Chloroflexota bacterium]